MKPIVMCLAGDVMLGRGVDQILPHPSQPILYEPVVHDAHDYVALAEETHGPIPRPVDVGYVWGDARRELARADVRIINLETSVTSTATPAPHKDIHYRMHPSNVGCLENAHIDVCVLANNHVLDWGPEGLIETLATLRGAGIQTVGAGTTMREAQQPAIVDANGRRILVVAAGHRSSGVFQALRATASEPGVAVLDDLDESSAKAFATRALEHRRSGDVVVASIHWGTNWGYDVPDSHVRFAHALVELGVDLVHGHSSHHPRRVEIYEGKPILYGCGDLVNDYEGIAHHDEFRGDLVLLYLASFRERSCELRLVPFRLRRMRLERANLEEAEWLATKVTDASNVAIGTEGELMIAPICNSCGPAHG